MPEGHTVHRIARLFDSLFRDETVRASSPQGRFSEGAQVLSGRVVTGVRAHGKQLFIEWEGDLVVRVHLGIYGAWDVATLEGGTARAGGPAIDSLGAPRVSRARLAEWESERSEDIPFPPPPVGAVRLRLETDTVVADLRGPTACEVITLEQEREHTDKLGPDPLIHRGARGEDMFLRSLTATQRPLGIALMDQSVVSGIGNVYRAELLFRLGLDPFAPASRVDDSTARELWRAWASLLSDGVKTGVMVTRDDLDASQKKKALRDPALRHFVYKRHGRECLRCGSVVAMDIMQARKLYFCPGCQVHEG